MRRSTATIALIALITLITLTSLAACSRQSSSESTAAAQKPVSSGVDSSSMDKAVRPQDDLFRHVNGAWLARTEIPADKSSYGAFDILIDKTQEDLRGILENASKAANKTSGSDAQKIGDFYESFINEARADEIGLQPLSAELATIDRIATRSDLARHFARMFKLNLTNPLIGYVESDAKQPGYDTLYVYQGGLGLPDRDYYIKDDPALKTYREKYLGFLGTILTLANHQSPEETAKQIYALESRLARSHWTNVESRDAVKTYNKVAVAELDKEFPGFDWATWTTELGIQGAPAVVIAQPSYVKAFAKAVNDVPVDQWKPYIRASLLNGFAPYLHKPMVDAEFGFYGQTLRGMKENEPRWKRGVDAVNRNLGEVLGKLYVERHFTPVAKARMEQLVANLQRAFKEGIDQLEWMSPPTKQQAQEKLARFRPKIGYPNTWRDYSRVEVVRDDLVGNLMRAYIAERQFQLAKVGKPIDPEQWSMTPQTVNAYNNPVRNEIVFPAAILQPPFFNLAADDAVNYGAIGVGIGHEMGHGFDDQGRHYDGTGELRDWWTAKDAEEYTRRAKLLVEQYNEFEALPGLHVNGELTLGENIGDLTGVVIAHRAYELSLAGQPAPTIDGMSGDQRFFFGFAQIWRGKERDDALRQKVMYRANAPVRNVPEFYSTFGVKEGDRMWLAPEKRTKIW
jgi:predicted metalloendopeptidase